MSQSQSTQQLGLKDFQLWQQHLMYKQLKEIHRQKQLQQIHQGTKQQNSLRQIYGVTTQQLANQLPPMPPGMGTNKASTCLWSNEMVGHYSKAAPSTQVVIPGIMNCAQHSRVPVMQGLPDVLSYQAIQSTNSLPQWLDPSLCGNPVSTGRGSLDNHSQFQGLSHGCIDSMTHVNRNQAAQASFQFASSDFSQSEQHGFQSCLQNDILVSKEGFREKDFFRDSPVQSLNSGSGSASIQLTNEDLQGREQADWPGCLQEKLVSQVKPSDAANLDQNKHRLLSSKDEDGCWDASFRSGNICAEGYPYGNHLDSNEYSSACPSVQSGSWSALMQEALGASSSDMVVQEDWSDLTFQNAELSSGSHSAILNESAKQSNWENNNLQGSSSLTSRPFPFCSDADESPNSFPMPTVEQSLMENSYEHDEGMLANNTHDFFWQQREQMNNNQLYQSHDQKQCLGGGKHPHIQDTEPLSGAWAGQMHELSGDYANSSMVELNAENLSDIWAQTKKTQFHYVGDQCSGRPQPPHGWISNSSGGLKLVKSAGGSSEMSIEDPDANHVVPAIISNSSELNQEMDEASGVTHFNCERHAAIDSSNRNAAESHQHQPSLCQQASHTLLNAPAKDTVVSYDNGQKCGGNDNSSFAGRPSPVLLSSSQMSSDQYFAKSLTPHNFQHYPMGDSEMIHGDFQNQRPFSKGSSQLFALSSETQNLGSVDRLHFPALANLSNAVNMRKGHIIDSEKTAKKAEQIQSTRTVTQHAPTSVALDTSAATFPQKKRIRQTSQLLHKADQSREGAGVALFCSYDDNTPPGARASAAPNSFASNILHNQPSASQDFMLGLAPPSQGKPFLNHSFPLQSSLSTLSGFGSEHVDLQAWNRDQQTPSASITGQSASQAHDASQSALYSTALASCTLPHLSSQQLQQGMYSSSYIGVDTQAKSLSLEGHLNYNPQVRQTEEFRDNPLADQSSQTLFATTLGRNCSGNLPSQFYSLNKGHSQRTHIGSLSQEQSTDLATLASKPSVTTSGVPGSLPKMLHGVWLSPSDQECLSRVQLQKISNLVQLQGILPQSGKTNSLFQQMVDYPSSKKGASGTYSTSVQHGIFEEHDQRNSLQQIPSSKEVDITPSAGPALQAQETVPKHGNRHVSTYFVHPREQDLIKGKHSWESSLLSQMQHLPSPNFISSDNEFGQTQEPTDIHKGNYSLFQQIQKRKGVTSDLCEDMGKRLKGSNIDDDAQQIDLRAIQSNVNAQYTGFNLPTEGDQDTTTTQNLFASSLQMSSFSSREIAEKGVNGSLQFGGKDMPSQNLLSSGQQSSKNNAQFLSVRSTSSSLGDTKGHQTTVQITPALTGQTGTSRNGQILVCDGLNSSEWSPITTARTRFSKRDCNSMNDNNLVEQRGDACKGGRFCQNTQSVIPTAMASPHSWPLDAVDHIAPQPKKRKRETPELLPWHKELTQGSRRLCSISMAETNWAKTTNRLMEKVENMMIGDGPLVPPRKRLVLTTQLMQQIIMSVPAAIIKANAFVSYEDVVYHVAKLALGNACSLIACLGNNTSVHSDSRNMLRTYHIEGANALSEAMEDFIDKSRKLESDFFRLENRASISDVRMEFQNLERCSIIHRFAKFHGCSQTERLETSLASDIPPGILLQRLVTKTSVSANHLEGVVCFSL